MGHLQSVLLPNTKSWREVVGLIEAGGEAAAVARMALARALTEELDARLPTLFAASPADIRSALGKLAGGRDFADFARRFFASLTAQTLASYLSRTLADHTGPERRFASDAERVAFDRAIERHAWESAAIVGAYADGWYGKNVWQGDGPTPRAIRGFASCAFTKLRRELASRRDAA